MVTNTEINIQINALNLLYEDLVEYSDSVDIQDEDLKTYVTSDTLLKNNQMAVYSAIQELEQLRKNSLKEFVYKTNSDTTVLNICFLLYTKITDELIDSIIASNDLLGTQTTSKDPYSPIIKKNTNIIYYK